MPVHRPHVMLVVQDVVPPGVTIDQQPNPSTLSGLARNDPPEAILPPCITRPAPSPAPLAAVPENNSPIADVDAYPPTDDVDHQSLTARSRYTFDVGLELYLVARFHAGMQVGPVPFVLFIPSVR
jgi:hypothetical protein